MLDNDRLLLDDLEVGELAVEYETQEPEDVLEWAMSHFPEERFAIVTSFQIDGSVLIDMAYRINPRVRVITVDTGRMPQEQYDIIDTFRRRYGIQVEVLFPDARDVESMVKKHGVNLFYDSVKNRLLCCQVRKVVPQVRVLKELDCWVTGLRRDQWATRANIKKIEIDHDHGGIIKLCPLADWSEEMVWEYAHENEVPIHPSYAKGFKSLGCVPCTRPIQIGEHSRSGRWWWETDAPKECGMHCSIETGGFEHELEAILGHQNGVTAGH
jgi:phosphoadenosine phosphosulfate reductase